MKNFSRRSLFATGGIIGAGALLTLAGCTSGQTNAQIAQTVLTDAQLVANGLANAVTNLGSVGNVPAAVLAQIKADATAAATAAADLSAAMTATVAQPVIMQIQSAVQTFTTDLGTFISSPAVQSILADIQVVLPVLLSAVGILAAGAVSGGTSAVDAARSRLASLPHVSVH